MSYPKLPEIIETPKHFWFGATDLAFATDDATKVKKLGNGMVAITKTFICHSYKYYEKDSLYDFSKPIKDVE